MALAEFFKICPDPETMDNVLQGLLIPLLLPKESKALQASYVEPSA